jgi:hypothetical protein
MATYLKTPDGRVICKDSPLFSDKTLKTFTDKGYKVVDKPGTVEKPVKKTPVKADKE